MNELHDNMITLISMIASLTLWSPFRGSMSEGQLLLQLEEWLIQFIQNYK